MADMILVKVAPIGKPVVEVMLPMNSTVRDAIASSKVSADGYNDLRKNGKVATMSDLVNNNDIITLVPAIRGGI